jgi:SnoaL-like domain
MAERLDGRSTREVLEDHLRLRAAGDLEADLRRNISPDIALLTRTGTWRGHDGVRAQADALARYTGHNGYGYDAVVVEGEMGYLEWRANGHGKMKIEHGADSYVVRDGKLVGQSIYYDVEDGDGDLLDSDGSDTADHY